MEVYCKSRERRMADGYQWRRAVYTPHADATIEHCLFLFGNGRFLSSDSQPVMFLHLSQFFLLTSLCFSFLCCSQEVFLILPILFLSAILQLFSFCQSVSAAVADLAVGRAHSRKSGSNSSLTPLGMSMRPFTPRQFDDSQFRLFNQGILRFIDLLST